MKSRRASWRTSAVARRLSAASDAASSQRRRVGRKTIAGNKLYEPSAASRVAGGISGMRSFMFRNQSYKISLSEKGEMSLCEAITSAPLRDHCFFHDLPSGRKREFHAKAQSPQRLLFI